MNNRAQGLPLNVIIVASLCVIVLVVLILIFTRHGGVFQGQVNDCDGRGGHCVPGDKCRGAVIGGNCGGVSTQVIGGIEYTTLGSTTVCCLTI